MNEVGAKGGVRFCGVQGMSVVRSRGSRARRYGRCADGDAGGVRGVRGAASEVVGCAGWRRAEVWGVRGWHLSDRAFDVFCKRHGRATRLGALFDRAFDVFL